MIFWHRPPSFFFNFVIHWCFMHIWTVLSAGRANDCICSITVVLRTGYTGRTGSAVDLSQDQSKKAHMRIRASWLIGNITQCTAHSLEMAIQISVVSCNQKQLHNYGPLWHTLIVHLQTQPPQQYGQNVTTLGPDILGGGCLCSSRLFFVAWPSHI